MDFKETLCLATFSVSFCYPIHGIPEISAYFLGALRGA